MISIVFLQLLLKNAIFNWLKPHLPYNQLLQMDLMLNLLDQKVDVFSPYRPHEAQAKQVYFEVQFPKLVFRENVALINKSETKTLKL